MKSSQKIIYLSSSSRISFLFYGLSIICLTFATVSASYGGNETDYHALLSFKSKITQDPYKVLTSWNHSFHFCEWSGISCGKRHKRVTALQLDSKGLEGSLSPHVGNLSFLRKLSLSNNNFKGTIPHELGRLSRLRHLYLSINKFGGVIQTNLSRCSNLEDLWLNRNELTGSIPKEISLLSKLARLKIEYNKLTGGIPSFLGNITSMEVFSSAENPLGGSIPDTLGLWKSLTTFESGDCNLYGSIPPSIFNLSLLVNFSLPDNHLTGTLPSEIGNQLPKLEWLQLRDNELTGILPPSISNCSKLGRLEMVYKHQIFIKFLGGLELLDISENNYQMNDRLLQSKFYIFINVELSKFYHGSESEALRNITTPLVATALDYLHNCCQTTIVHGDLKPSNILLDADMVAHVGDFGLARLLGTDLNQNSSTGVKGTIGYAPPEYGIGSEMTSIGDVYSFGILVLEVMTRKNPTDGMFNEGLSLHKFLTWHYQLTVIDVIDDDAIVLQSTEANANKVEECMAATIKIGVSCSVDSPPQRMKIEIVVTELSAHCGLFCQFGNVTPPPKLPFEETTIEGPESSYIHISRIE
ncbi:leucine-rich repeat protein [Tanacetum coccineum]